MPHLRGGWSRHIPPFGPEAQKGFHILNKRPSGHGATAGPFLLTDFLKTTLLAPEKLIIGPIHRAQIAFSNSISDTSRGPTPLRTALASAVACCPAVS
jgi:hypothetical protein